jgi:acyl-CoA synthetase (AMP-forming)/AMP-acid ligase II
MTGTIDPTHDINLDLTKDRSGADRTHPASLGTMAAGNMLATAARRFRDREALFCAGTQRRFSYRQLNERSNRLAHGLLSLGLRKSDVVGFLCNNRAEILEIYFALAKLGVVGIPLNYRLASAEIVTLMQAMGARTAQWACRSPSSSAASIARPI